MTENFHTHIHDCVLSQQPASLLKMKSRRREKPLVLRHLFTAIFQRGSRGEKLTLNESLKIAARFSINGGEYGIPNFFPLRASSFLAGQGRLAISTRWQHRPSKPESAYIPFPRSTRWDRSNGATSRGRPEGGARRREGGLSTAPARRRGTGRSASE